MINVNRFIRLEKQIDDLKLDVYGIEVYCDDALVYKHFWKDDIVYPIYSATKTYTSTVVGIACDMKLMSVNDSIVKYLDEETIRGINNSSFDVLSKLSLEDFLTMSISGYPFRPQGEDWLLDSLNTKIQLDIEKKAHYSNVPAYLIGIACENAVEMPFMEFSDKYLFQMMNSPVPRFITDSNGRYYGATGFEMRLSDFSKLGLLWLNNGCFDGLQVVSSSWINRAVQPYTVIESESYGYFVWVYGDYYCIKGKWGQNCIVFPKEKIVVSYLSSVDNRTNQLQKIVVDSII